MARGLPRGTIRRPQTLAARLADFARELRALVRADLAGPASPSLRLLYEQAGREITPDLSHDDFADLLAQVLVYCCLRVRCSSQEQQETFAQALRAFLALPGLPDFVRRLLLSLCVPILRTAQARSRKLPRKPRALRRDAESPQETLPGSVEKLVTFLLATDTRALLDMLRPACFQGDPLIYFYEIFLSAYAPRQRSQRGVYYTPTPVIAYMVRAIDTLLRERFAFANGLAGTFQDEQLTGGVFLCDPACGTGAFLRAVLEHVALTYQASERPGDWQHTLSACILPRLSGYEIMPVAYLLACIELATHQAALDQPGKARAPKGEASARSARSCIALANALATARPLAPVPTASLPIMLGNPPYAGHSLNHSDWLAGLLESYKAGDAGLKKPAQTKWLSDDYVQFLRLAQWQVEQAGRGIVAFLTSHSYLDNPTFREMRLSLLRCFDEIYILDLHGNSKRRELAPGGERDRNIFTIQQGVAISIFVKHDAQPTSAASVDTPEEGHLATLYHVDVWGSKAVYSADEQGEQQLSGGKLGWLATHDLSNTPWQVCQPTAPFYLFTPRDDDHRAEYMTYWSLPAIFALNGDPAPGLLTCQDEFAVSWSAEEMESRIAALLASENEAEARSHFRLCAQGQWNYDAARSALSTGAWRNALGRVSYRPFDARWTVFERHVAVHLRERVTRHMRAGSNIALAVGRAGQVINGGDAWDVAFCSRLPSEFNLFRRGGNYLFPLYLYAEEGAARTANLAPAFIAQASQRLGLRWLPDGYGDLVGTFGPDDLFAYIYALLFAHTYRARYLHFLKIDFPRVPLPTHGELFRALCPLGRALSQAHLLEADLPVASAWSGAGDPLVERVRYRADAQGGRVSINASWHLDHVPAAAWELTIGGYQVAKKWLWDRRGRHLTADELDQYRRIIASLVQTHDLMAAIDYALAHHGGWPL